MTEGFPTIPLGERNQEMIPFTRDTQLVGYLTLPKSLFHLGLSPGALLVYTLLLDRGKLSQRSGWTDKKGWVYVIYRVRDLAETLEKGMTTIKRWLRELEDRDLIFRTLPMRGEAGWIFLRVPAYSVAGEREKALGLPPPKPIRRDPWEEPAWTPKAPKSPQAVTPRDVDRMVEELTRLQFSTSPSRFGRGPALEGGSPNLDGGGAGFGP